MHICVHQYMVIIYCMDIDTRYLGVGHIIEEIRHKRVIHQDQVQSSEVIPKLPPSLSPPPAPNCIQGKGQRKLSGHQRHKHTRTHSRTHSHAQTYAHTLNTSWRDNMY